MTNRRFKAGVSRAQPRLLPPSVEDYVGPGNPVRAIDAYVEALDLAKLGFRHAGTGGGGAGQPPYDPAELLKLYCTATSIGSARRAGWSRRRGAISS